MNAEKTGNFICELRKAKNLTQRQLSDMLGVSDKAISRWETGKGFPEISIMEDLARVLDVSIAELLKGEAIKDETSSKEIIDITDDSYNIFKTFIKKERLKLFGSGFIFGLILIVISLTHLFSPIYFDNPSEIVRIEKLNDSLVAVLDEKVAGYDIDSSTMDNDKYIFISCYKTKWYELFANKQEKIISLAKTSDVGFVSYYPSLDEDNKTIYSNGKTMNGGVVTLPRLIYNYWIVIGIAFSFVSLSVYYVYRKRYFAKTVFKIASFFISFTLSVVIVLLGKMDKVYNASYYLSGILLLTILLTFLASLLMTYKTKTE